MHVEHRQVAPLDKLRLWWRFSVPLLFEKVNDRVRRMVVGQLLVGKGSAQSSKEKTAMMLTGPMASWGPLGKQLLLMWLYVWRRVFQWGLYEAALLDLFSHGCFF
jgi:hypothetical protein